jgi:hypothetical protein
MFNRSHSIGRNSTLERYCSDISAEGLYSEEYWCAQSVK